MKPAMRIQLKGVSIHYRDTPVLENLNLGFVQNVVTGIIGASGSGKTTLLRTLSRMNDRVDGFRVQGEVLLDGQNIYCNGLDVYRLRQKVGMVFQKPCVFPKSIFENVVFGLKHSRLFFKRHYYEEVVEQTLREVFLWDEVRDRLDKAATELSQGQQHRLAIARTLAVNPEILLMDEPTSALDPRSAAGIQELIVSLKSRHAVILVTHNLAQARQAADEIVFLHEGRVCERGASHDFFSSPQRPETRAYLSSGAPVGQI